MSHRYRWPQRTWNGDPSGPHVTRAIVDHAVIAGTAIGFVGDTAQLTATAYDRTGNVVTGIEIDWSSSQPAMISVIAGLCTFLVAGTATITATIDGRAYTTTALSAAPLALTLDWAPVANPSEIASPLIAPSSGRTDGFTDTTVIPGGSGIFNGVRTAYPRTLTTWAESTFQETAGGSSVTPSTHFTGTAVAAPGPVDGSSAFDIPFLGGFESISYAGWTVDARQPVNDNQDVTDFRRGAFLGLLARTSADVGTKVYVQLADITTDSSTPNVFVTQTVTIQSTMVWQYIGLELDAQAHLTNLAIIVRPAFSDSPIATGVRVLDNSLAVGHLPDRTVEYPRMNAWHASYGLLSQFQHTNAWAEAGVTLSPGASVVASATDAPDAACYFSGHKLDTYTMPNGGYVVGNGLFAVTQLNAGGTEAPTALWVHVYAPGLASGSLQASVVDGASTTYGPTTMTVTDLPGFHRARFPVNLFSQGEKQFTPKVLNNSGSTLVFDATRFAMTCEEDRNQGRHNAIVPVRAQAFAASSDAAFNEIKDLSSLVTRAEGIWGVRYMPLLADVDVMAMWPGDSPEFWQSGPFGSDDDNFAAGTRNSPAHPGNAEIYITMNRGAGFEAYASWGASFIIAPGQLPKKMPFDLIVAWKAGAVVALGIGGGAGTAITWLTNGQIYNGFPVSITSTPGLAWEISDAGTIASGARHIARGGDRDNTREDDCADQGGIASKTVNPATVQTSCEVQIAKRLGPRALAA